MKKTKLQIAMTVIFFGSIWGIAEASVGYLLHFLPVLWSGTLMFPFVAYILYRVYKRTDSKAALLGAGIIAAGIKSVNLFFPAFSIWKTINPMISIIAESLMVMVVITLFNKDDLKSKLIAFPIASVAWRAIFLVNLGIQYFATGFLADYLVSFYAVLDFTVIFGLISALIIDAIVVIAHFYVKRDAKTFNLKITPVMTGASFALAIATTVLVSVFL